MLADRVASLVPQLALTARLLEQGSELTVPGYEPQVVKFRVRGAVASGEVTFRFDAPFQFDTLEYREGEDLVHSVSVSYAGPAGEFTDRLLIEVGSSQTT